MLYNNYGLKFEYSFSSDAAYSYLVVHPENGHMLQNHQVEIICRNPNPALVAFYTRRENADISIFYNITSRISLSQYLERKGLNRGELLELLRNIVKGLMLHGNYLLELSSYVMDPGFIFINPATAEVSLLYIPVSCSRNSTEVFKGLIRDIVVNYSEIDESTKDNYVQRILGYLKSDTFSLHDFNRLITDLRYYMEKSDKIPEAASVQEGKAVDRAVAVTERLGSGLQATPDRKYIMRLLLLQLLIALPAIIICLFLVSRGMGDPVTITGFLIIAAALDMFLIGRVFGKLPKKTTNGIKKRQADNKNKMPDPVLRIVSNAAEAPTPDVAKACDTVMISEAPKSAFPYLERADGKRYEKVVISKSKFIIGRLDSMVDHAIPDSTIGKLHAKIVCREEGYFMKDLNSKNGTYVNGSRLTCNEEYEIKDNYRIRFSSHEFIFRR